MPEENRILSRNFILITLAAIGSFSSVQFLMTVIPLYVLSAGRNKADIGLVAGIIALYFQLLYRILAVFVFLIATRHEWKSLFPF